MEEDFDLDKLLAPGGGVGGMVPKYMRGKRRGIGTIEQEKRDAEKREAHKPSSSSATAKSPNVQRRGLKGEDGGGVKKGDLTSPRAGGSSRATMSSPRASAASLRAPGSKGAGGKKCKVNAAQTTLIIEMRLQKELQALRESKPSLHVKRELLRTKLRDIRLSYKVGLPSYIELMMKEDYVRCKVISVEDVKLMLAGKGDLKDKTVEAFKATASGAKEPTPGKLNT